MSSFVADGVVTAPTPIRHAIVKLTAVRLVFRPHSFQETRGVALDVLDADKVRHRRRSHDPLVRPVDEDRVFVVDPRDEMGVLARVRERFERSVNATPAARYHADEVRTRHG